MRTDFAHLILLEIALTGLATLNMVKRDTPIL